jgi:hypothetical protein
MFLRFYTASAHSGHKQHPTMRSVADIPATTYQTPRFDSLIKNTISPVSMGRSMLFAFEADHAAERRGRRQAQHHFEFTGA